MRKLKYLLLLLLFIPTFVNAYNVYGVNSFGDVVVSSDQTKNPIYKNSNSNITYSVNTNGSVNFEIKQYTLADGSIQTRIVLKKDVFDGWGANNKEHYLDKDMYITFYNAGYYYKADGTKQFVDIQYVLTRVTVYKHAGVGTVKNNCAGYYKGTYLFQIAKIWPGKIEFSSEMYDTKNPSVAASSPGYLNGVKIEYTTKIFNHGTSTLVPNPIYATLFTDIDIPDYSAVHYSANAEYNNPNPVIGGPYAESINFISGYSGNYYVLNNTYLGRNELRFYNRTSNNTGTGSVAATNRAGVYAIQTSNTASAVWTGSKCGTFITGDTMDLRLECVNNPATCDVSNVRYNSGNSAATVTSSLSTYYYGYPNAWKKDQISYYTDPRICDGMKMYALDFLKRKPDSSEGPVKLTAYQLDEINGKIVKNGSSSSFSSPEFARALYYIVNAPKNSYSEATKAYAVRLLMSATGIGKINTATTSASDYRSDGKTRYYDYARTAYTWLKGGTDSYIIPKAAFIYRDNPNGNYSNAKVLRCNNDTTPCEPAGNAFYNNVKKLITDAVNSAKNFGDPISINSTGEQESIDGYYQKKVIFNVTSGIWKQISISNVSVDSGATWKLRYKKSNGTYDSYTLNSNLKGINSVELIISIPQSKVVNNNVDVKYALTYKYCEFDKCTNTYILKPDDTGYTGSRLIAIDNTCNSNGGHAGTKGAQVKFEKLKCPSVITTPKTCGGENDVCNDKNNNLENNYLTSKFMAYDENDSSKSVSACIIGNKDTSDNSYKLDNEFTGVADDKCEVYCKEDYVFQFSKTKRAVSGRYFRLPNTIKNTTTCYMNGSPGDCLTSAKNIVNNIGKMSFFSNENNELKYSYEDEYFKDKNIYNNQAQYFTKSLGKINYSLMYGTNADANYNITGGGTSTNLDSVRNLGSNVNYMKLTIDATATYTPKDQYYNSYPTGEITNKTNRTPDSNPVDGLPVKINTTPGIYEYKLYFDKIGSYFTGNNKGQGGRVTALLKDTKTINNSKFEGTYICYYGVNHNCKDNSCEYINGKYYGKTKNLLNSKEAFDRECLNCPTCHNTCDNCLFDNGIRIDYRTVTDNDMNPLDRNLGYNWSTTSSYSIIDAKAKKTIENIEKNDNPVEKESNPILTIKMTPNIANSIREYNKSNAYDNDSLTCYDNKENGVTNYNDIYCYSDYLDKLKKDYNSNITFSSDRLAESSRTDEKVTKSKYWTIWTTIDGVITSSPNDAGGPSWQ